MALQLPPMRAIASYALVCFGSLFLKSSIRSPRSPIFLALTGSTDHASRQRTALRASLTCFLVLTTFALGGQYIFSYFSITIPAFKLAGGVLLFGVGMEMMSAKQSNTRTTTEEQVEAESKEGT